MRISEDPYFVVVSENTMKVVVLRVKGVIQISYYRCVISEEDEIEVSAPDDVSPAKLQEDTTAKARESEMEANGIRGEGNVKQGNDPLEGRGEIVSSYTPSEELLYRCLLYHVT